jgi:hypothetical protein
MYFAGREARAALSAAALPVHEAAVELLTILRDARHDSDAVGCDRNVGADA